MGGHFVKCFGGNFFYLSRVACDRSSAASAGPRVGGGSSSAIYMDMRVTSKSEDGKGN